MLHWIDARNGGDAGTGCGTEEDTEGVPLTDFTWVLLLSLFALEPPPLSPRFSPSLRGPLSPLWPLWPLWPLYWNYSGARLLLLYEVRATDRKAHFGYCVRFGAQCSSMSMEYGTLY